MRLDLILEAASRTPWAMLPEKLAQVLLFLRLEDCRRRDPEAAKSAELEELAAAARKESAARDERRSEASADGVHVIPILGSIVRRGANLNSSGITPTEAISRELAAGLASKDIDAILMDIDSPGGSVDGVTELASDIRRARNEKPIFASVNGLGASAAYWIASQATRISMSPSSEVGAIGVFAAHEDLSAALEAEGVKLTLVSAGEFKTENNPFEPITEEGRAEIQRAVDHFHDLFISDVAKGRGTSADSVREDFGRGRLLRANQALAAGMVDHVETFETTVARAGMAARAARLRSKIETPRQLESFLREVGGFGAAEAKRIASGQTSQIREGSPAAVSEIRQLCRKHLRV